jgi:hypothetical protein
MAAGTDPGADAAWVAGVRFLSGRDPRGDPLRGGMKTKASIAIVRRFDVLAAC